jgi:hypothetical protein
VAILAAAAGRSILNWRRLTHAVALILALAIAAQWGIGALQAQQPPAPASPPRAVIDVQALGPQVGVRIPDFTLIDQTGAPRTLRSLMGPKGLMLVLFRSADW